MIIRKQDIIRLKPKTQIEFNNNGNFTLHFNELKIKKEVSVLKVFEVYSTWKTIESGVKELAKLTSTKEEFINASADFYDLLKKDFFEFKSSNKITFGFHNALFDSFPVHIRMLNDKSRTLSFQEALRRQINTNDIVLDIGTGSGILAATAALAGAKHVYAIERTDFIEVAKAVFKFNGLENKITLIKGNSIDITLPEKATVLVSEIIGNDPFEEGIIHTFSDAKVRLLTRDARIIPQSIKVFAMAMEYDSEVYNQYQLSTENISNWKEWYGVDFSPFFEFNNSENLQKISTIGLKPKSSRALSSPIELTHLNFTNQNLKVEDCEKVFSIENNGTFNGIHLFFEIALSDCIILSIHPQKVDANNSWALQHHFISPRKVKDGEIFKLGYSFKDLKTRLKIVPVLRFTS